MLTFLQVIKMTAKEVVPVDCPTCPVSMACVAGIGGNGWRFDCCGSTGIPVENGTLFVDCAINRFERHHKVKDFPRCPVCSGGIMEVIEAARRGELASVGMNYYLPTVHAVVPLADRLVLLRRKHREATRHPGLAISREDEKG